MDAGFRRHDNESSMAPFVMTMLYAGVKILPPGPLPPSGQIPLRRFAQQLLELLRQLALAVGLGQEVAAGGVGAVVLHR